MKVKGLLLVLGIFCSAWPARALDLYVATTGSDSNPGTIGAPFATIPGAQAVIRHLAGTTGLPAGGINVWLAAGVYNQTASIDFESTDSGTSACPITYAPEPGQQVEITGGVSLSPGWFALVTSSSPIWSRLDPSAQGNVYQVNLAAYGISNYGTIPAGGYGVNVVSPMELFFNDRPMILARWPNIGQPMAAVATVPSSSSITYSGNRPSRWSQASNIWFHGLWGSTYADYHLEAASITTGSSTINFTAAPPMNGITAGSPYYAYNLLEEIDEPGEYYIDRSSGILYFWPPAPLVGANIQVSMMSNAVIRFDSAQYITLRNLIVEVARGPLVMMNAGNNLELEECLLRNSGQYAVQMNGAASTVDQCEIVDCGEDGVRIAGGARATLTAGANAVTNCRIHQVGRINWGDHPAVNFYDGCGNKAANNLIDEMPHIGVLISGNNHQILNNEIRHTCLLTSDVGAIYSGRDWGYRGNVISGNYIHHIISSQPGNGANGIYLDDLMSSATVSSNVFYEVAGGAIFCGGGRDNIMTGNVMANCGMAHFNGDYARGFVDDISGDSWNLLQRLAAEGIAYQSGVWASEYPACAAIPNSYAAVMTGLWRNPQNCVFNSNVGWGNANWTVQSDVSGTGVFSVYASMANNNSTQAALFTDAESLDRSIRPPTLVAAASGFGPIAFSAIGRNFAGQPAATLAPPTPVLTYTAITNSSINLQWSDYGNLPNQQETGFEVQRANDPSGAWEVVTDFGPDVTFCTDNGLAPAMSYSYRVRVWNAAGSVYSNTLMVDTLAPNDVPGTPVQFEADSPLDVVTSIGTHGAVAVVTALGASNQKAVSLFDPGDAISLPFTVPAAGTYRLAMRLRSGDLNLPLGTSYWPNGYSFAVDGAAVTLTGDPTTVSPLDTSMGSVYWGTMFSPPVSLSAGAHALVVTSNSLFAAADNLQVAPFVPPPPPTTFGGWQAVYFTSGQLANDAVSGWNAIIAGDGMENLLKYALGFNPWVAISGNGVQTFTSNNEPVLAYTRPVGLTDVAYYVDASDDDATWTTLTSTVLSTSNGVQSVQAVDSGVPHQYLRLRVVSGTETAATPALPTALTTMRFEAENTLTVVTALNTLGPVDAASDPTCSNKQFVWLHDSGDTIRLNFTCAAGTYRLDVRVRSGDALGATSFWPGGYSFALDGAPITCTGDTTTLSATDIYYPVSYWGTMTNPSITLTAGAHTLTIHGLKNWAMVDYFELVQ